MRITRSIHDSPRRGTVLPMLAVCLIGLCGFTALAVDLGILAVARTESQNGADIAALIGCRTLNNKPTAVNNDLPLAVAAAKSSAMANYDLNQYFTLSQIQKVEVGQYLYDAAAQKFQVNTWYDVTSNTSTTPPAGSWTAIRVTLAVNQPTYFMKVFGVTSMPTGAIATAVYRPRDTAFVLDMTGSMAYASTFNYNGDSMNPDDLIPNFGHYVSVQTHLRATANQANPSGEAMSRNNFTITTPGGLPIVRDFYYDTANVATPATVAMPVVPANLKNAFHNIPASKETVGDPTNYVPPTYDFSGYNAFDTTRVNGPTPAPTSFMTMTDGGGIIYVGDRYRRYNGSINKVDTTWATGTSPNWAATKAAANAIELLGYNISGGIVRRDPTGTTNVTGNPTPTNFRDLVWGQNGYDLDIVQYRTDKTNSDPKTPSPASSALAGFTAESVATGTYVVPVVAAADRFKGYSMGPGYWGKTFFIWPPDPRWGDGSATAADPTNPGASGVKDANGRWIADWRRRFFLDRNSALFNPQTDNNSATTGAGNIEGINEVLMNTAAGLTVANSTTNWLINYPAVLKWIKSGPQTLPPNLRAGRVLYYSSIPNDVNTGTGTANEKLDKIFWKKYIDYVIGYSFTSTTNLYGVGDSWIGGTRSISTSDLTAWAGPSSLWPSQKPYMPYNDSPNRPRLHMFFGPLSMMDFVQYGNGLNWNSGTCHEAQCWQLKAGVNSVIDDVRNNRPNDYIGMVMFSASYSGSTPTGFNGPRVEIGQNYSRLKNALFYPKSLLVAIDGGNTTSEVRPFDTSFNTVITPDEIPNANGSTDPNTGLAYAFNLLSPSTLTSTNPATGSPQGYGTLKGRRGAAKMVIFETDGVPNTYSGLSSGTHTMNPTLKGYDTYYPVATWTSQNIGNGVQPCMSEAVKVTQQIVKPMATVGAAGGNGVDSGLSLPNAPARVYPVGFGDIFDPVASPGAVFRGTALQFLADVGAAGNTGVAGASSPPSKQIITGPYDQRISRLKDCLEQIFETGVSVALIE